MFENSLSNTILISTIFNIAEIIKKKYCKNQLGEICDFYADQATIKFCITL